MKLFMQRRMEMIHNTKKMMIKMMKMNQKKDDYRTSLDTHLECHLTFEK